MYEMLTNIFNWNKIIQHFKHGYISHAIGDAVITMTQHSDKKPLEGLNSVFVGVIIEIFGHKMYYTMMLYGADGTI